MAPRFPIDNRQIMVLAPADEFREARSADYRPSTGWCGKVLNTLVGAIKPDGVFEAFQQKIQGHSSICEGDVVILASPGLDRPPVVSCIYASITAVKCCLVV